MSGPDKRGAPLIDFDRLVRVALTKCARKGCELDADRGLYCAGHRAAVEAARADRLRGWGAGETNSKPKG